MKKVLCILLACAFLFAASGAFASGTAYEYASRYTPYELDQAFREYYGFLPWKTAVAEGSGMSAVYREEAEFDFHEYYFQVTGNGSCIGEITFGGWHDDMKMMSDAVFRSGLLAYTACVRTAAGVLPEGEELMVILDPYGFWDIISNGRPYEYTAGGWTVTAADHDGIEIVHETGAYVRIEYVDLHIVIRPVG